MAHGENEATSMVAKHDRRADEERGKVRQQHQETCARREGVGERLQQKLVSGEVEGDDEGGEKVESVLGRPTGSATCPTPTAG